MPEFEAEIKQIIDEADEIKTFVLTKPETFTFLPGQFCWLKLLGVSPSPMAIASGNQDDDLEFTIRAWGDFTTALFQKEVGDTVGVDGPHGTAFPFDQIDDNTIIYMIGGGTGITPIRSLVKTLGSKGTKFVFYGARNPEKLLYQYEIDEWDAHVKLTVDERDQAWEGREGVVTELLKNKDLVPSAYCFVCGPPAMEAATVQYLLKEGFEKSQIFVSLEEFDEEGNVIGPVLPVSHEQVDFDVSSDE